MKVKEALQYIPRTKLTAYNVKLFIMLVLFGDVVKEKRQAAETEDYNKGYESGWKSTYRYLKDNNLIK